MFLNVITYEYVDFYSVLCLSELFSGLLLFCDEVAVFVTYFPSTFLVAFLFYIPKWCYGMSKHFSIYVLFQLGSNFSGLHRVVLVVF